MKTRDVLLRIDNLPWPSGHREFYQRLIWWELNKRLPPCLRRTWFGFVYRHGTTTATAGRLYALAYNTVWRLKIVREVFRKRPGVRLL